MFGLPVTQGSKKAFVNPKTGRAVLVDDDSKGLKQWRAGITDLVTYALPRGWRPLDRAVAVELTFRLPRPEHGSPGYLVAAEQPVNQQSGDVDKLARAVLDALTTAKVYTDDCRITRLVIEKTYPAPGERHGVEIDVRWTAADPGGPRPVQEQLTT